MRNFLTTLILGSFPMVLAAGEILWNEDGTNLSTSGKYSAVSWFANGKEPLIKAREGGGFTLGSNCSKILPVEPGMWFTFEIDAVRRTGKPSEYHAWILTCPGLGKLAGNVTNIPVGLYTIRLVDAQKMKKPFAFYVYHGEIDFRYMRIESQPENSLEVIVPEEQENLKAGDTFRVELRLKDPCEDVSCKFLQEYGRGPVPLMINGKDSFELKPADDSCKVWVADVKIDKVKSIHRLLKRRALVKVTVLGGKLDKPVFTSFPVPIVQDPEPVEK